MRLIAKKPCSFGGKKFFIGEEVPAHLVANPELQEKLGVLAIGKNEVGEVPAAMAGTFTQEQVDEMVAVAVAELKETEGGAYDGIVTISVNSEVDGEMLAVPATAEEIQQVFSIMQLNAEDGAKAISTVDRENVLILLHAADSRKTVKDAARKQADNLFSTRGASNEARTGNTSTGTNPEGVDT